MNELVKIITDEDGVFQENSKWCYVHEPDSAPRALCTGQCFGYGEGVAKYKTKLVKRGGITCEQCLKIIKNFKKIKL